MKIETFKIAGISFHEKDIKKLALENDDFSLKKSDFVDYVTEGERAYKFDYPVNAVELVPEPDNEYDKNAIRVVADGIHIGYIKKGSTARIRNILKENMVKSIELEICGGKYKIWFENDNGRAELENGESPLSAKLTIKHGEEDPIEPKAKPMQEETTPKKKGLFSRLFGR